jgi:hypothetical protein
MAVHLCGDGTLPRANSFARTAGFGHGWYSIAWMTFSTLDRD